MKAQNRSFRLATFVGRDFGSPPGGHFVFCQFYFRRSRGSFRRVQLKRPKSSGPRYTATGLSPGDAARETDARPKPGTGTAVSGASSSPAAPATLHPQNPMAAAALRRRWWVSARPPGPHRRTPPSPTASGAGRRARPAALVPASRRGRRS